MTMTPLVYIGNIELVRRIYFVIKLGINAFSVTGRSELFKILRLWEQFFASG
jgi:hypothetical protein